ncbi:MAG: UbiA family prenyltransferase [Pseudomonadota bacterium]
MTLDVFLRLGRVSNLPTVWTNALAGAVLGASATGDVLGLGGVLLAALALSLFYVGGMWLNDAFDAEIDARERAARPIPSGEVDRGTVFAGGAGMLVLAVAIGVMLGAAVPAILLAGAVVLYDWLHKRTVLSPVIMGAARFFSIVFAAAATGAVTGLVIAGALGLFAYVVGLTYAAKQEAQDRIGDAWPLAVLAVPVLVALWMSGGAVWPLLILLGLLVVMGVALYRLRRRDPGDVPVAVVTLIAGIALYDAVLIAGAGAPLLALLAVAGFGATLLLQRLAPGT